MASISFQGMRRCRACPWATGPKCHGCPWAKVSGMCEDWTLAFRLRT
jgi:hypothetical protein